MNRSLKVVIPLLTHTSKAPSMIGGVNRWFLTIEVYIEKLLSEKDCLNYEVTQ